MAYDFSEQLRLAQDWLEQTIVSGRLTASARDELNALQDNGSQCLFASEDAAGKPLLVAFIGGTGVGKSSLLNRLAGQAIAKTGVERPTSREVTLFHHHDFSLQRLPKDAPLSSVRVAEHFDASNQRVVWIDMPDFDSVEASNHRLVLDWLPYLDVLIYVVSPERYRDAKAWQLLLAEGAKHAWLFVMNQWDRGYPAQFDDFQKQVQSAGFEQPLMFRTSCVETTDDQFAELVAHLQQLGSQQLSQQIRQHHIQQQQMALKAVLQQFQQRLLAQNYAALQQDVQKRMESDLQAMLTSMSLSMRQLAQAWAQNLAQHDSIQIWDAMLQSRFDDQLDEYLQLADQRQITVSSLKAKLEDFRQQVGKQVCQQAVQAGRLAMLKPGNSLQRALISTLAVMETLLPLIALAVVGYQVFLGYYQGAVEHSAYLGGDFAVHSLLLIGLSWLIPFFLHKKLQPSMEKAALRGLNQGAQVALRGVYLEIFGVLSEEQQQIQGCLQSLLELQSQIGQIGHDLPGPRAEGLRRALLNNA